VDVPENGAIARRCGERLSALRRDEVLDYLTELTRYGHTEWKVMRALDSTRILLSCGCGRQNLGLPEVREAWFIRRLELGGFEDATGRLNDELAGRRIGLKACLAGA